MRSEYSLLVASTRAYSIVSRVICPSHAHQAAETVLRIGRFEESGRDKETGRHTENSFMVPLVAALRRPPRGGGRRDRGE